MALPVSEMLEIKKGITAVFGSGGKSALLYALANTLPGRVLLCTTCYFYPFPQTAFLSRSDCTEEQEKEYLQTLLQENRVVCAGKMAGNGKLGRPISPFSRLRELADYVIVEADDARGMPLKAHASFEPPKPDEFDDALCVIGALGFMEPVSKVVHRPDVFQLLTGCAPDAPARPELVAKAYLSERLAKKALVNQVESREALAYAERFLNVTDDLIVVGSLKNNAFKRYL